MTTQQIKSEIQKVLDNVPEEVLETVLEYLKELQNQSGKTVNASQQIKRILTEDKELLQKLAQ